MIVYYILMNVIAYVCMYIDKQKAIHHKYRISELQLWLIALVLGALGMMIGMKQFHHKNKKWYFKYGLPLLSMIQIGLLLNLK